MLMCHESCIHVSYKLRNIACRLQVQIMHNNNMYMYNMTCKLQANVTSHVVCNVQVECRSCTNNNMSCNMYDDVPYT